MKKKLIAVEITDEKEECLRIKIKKVIARKQIKKVGLVIAKAPLERRKTRQDFRIFTEKQGQTWNLPKVTIIKR